MSAASGLNQLACLRINCRVRRFINRITSSIKIEAHAASESATKAVEAAGGSIQIVQQ